MYTITYQKADVVSSSLKYAYLFRDEVGDTFKYVLKVTDYYTNYSIWIRADTHEGQGRESEQIIVRTNASGKLIQFLFDLTRHAKHDKFIHPTHHRAPPCSMAAMLKYLLCLFLTQ